MLVCGQWYFCGAGFTILFGILLISLNGSLFEYLVATNMVLQNTSQAYQHWEHIPEPVPLSIYLFNWTNSQDIHNASIKPKVEQVGPYKYLLDLKKTNITFNNNGTVTYRQKRIYYQSTDNTNNLDEIISSLNVPAVSAGYLTRNAYYFMKLGLSIALSTTSNRLDLQGKIREFLFEGYPDSLTRISSNFASLSNMPKVDKFGYFYNMNGSDTLDATTTMGTGFGTTYGKVYEWNFKNHIPIYSGRCEEVDGSTGINFDVKTKPETIRMFFADMCRYFSFDYVGEKEVDGMIGYQYVFSDRSLDNGSLYEESACYCERECPPFGVINTTLCFYGTPSFISLPHFYRADEEVRNGVEGLNPVKEKHEFYLVVEPNLGLPLEVKARFQVNYLISPQTGIKMLENLPRVYFPVMWVEQISHLPRDFVIFIKIFVNFKSICIWTGCTLIVIGLFTTVYLVLTRRRKTDLRKTLPEMVPLNSQNAKK